MLNIAIFKFAHENRLKFRNLHKDYHGWVESKKRFERLLVFFTPYPTPPLVELVVSLKYMIISFQCVLSRDSFLDWEIAFYDVTYNFVLKVISVHGKVMNGILSPYLDAP